MMRGIVIRNGKQLEFVGSLCCLIQEVFPIGWKEHYCRSFPKMAIFFSIGKSNLEIIVKYYPYVGCFFYLIYGPKM